MNQIALNVNSKQPVEKVFFLSLRAKRGNLAFNKINGLEIASSQKLLLAMTCDGFFHSLSRADPKRPLLTLISRDNHTGAKKIKSLSSRRVTSNAKYSIPAKLNSNPED